MSVEEKIRVEVKKAELAGVYLPEKIEYDKFEKKYYQRIRVMYMHPTGFKLVRNFKFEFGSTDSAIDFCKNILSLFSSEELYIGRAFHFRDECYYIRDCDKLPNEGKDFIIKQFIKIKALFVNDKIVAIGNDSGTKWVRISDDGLHPFTGGIEEVKAYFIKEENEKIKRKYYKAISILKNITETLDDEAKKESIEDAIYILKITFEEQS